MTRPLTQRQMIGRLCLLLVALAALLAATACGADATAPVGPGCTLEADAGAGILVRAHYATCPAPAGATTYAFQGATYRVVWDGAKH